MKINIITGPFSCLPPDSIGAVEKLWYAIGNEWLNEGHDVTFICKKPKTSSYVKNKIYIKGYERTGKWSKDFLLDLLYSIKALKSMPDTDILILNSLWTPLLARIWKKKFKRVVYSVERFPKKQFELYRKFGKIDCFRCCSSAVYKELINQNPSSKKIACIIPNFIDQMTFKSDKTKHLSQNTTIVYAGRVHKEKGLDILMKAVELLYQRENRRISIIIIGAYDIKRGGSGEEYKAQLTSLAPNCNIEWIDPIYNPSELANKMVDGDIFCYPSIAEKGESFGVAPLEAMGLGIPVIVSSLECFKDFVVDGENALVFDLNNEKREEHLLEKIQTLMDISGLYTKCSREGMITAKKFSVSEISKLYNEKFEELLNG